VKPPAASLYVGKSSQTASELPKLAGSELFSIHCTHDCGVGPNEASGEKSRRVNHARLVCLVAIGPGNERGPATRKILCEQPRSSSILLWQVGHIREGGTLPMTDISPKAYKSDSPTTAKLVLTQRGRKDQTKGRLHPDNTRKRYHQTLLPMPDSLLLARAVDETLEVMS
jgi:hypothetical protein